MNQIKWINIFCLLLFSNIVYIKWLFYLKGQFTYKLKSVIIYMKKKQIAQIYHKMCVCVCL